MSQQQPLLDLDPRLVAMAEDALRDLVSEVGREAIAQRHRELVERLAKAMDQACQQEYGALVEELSA